MGRVEPPNDTAPPEPRAGARDIAALCGLALAVRLAFLALVPRVIDSADTILYLEAARPFPPDLTYAASMRIPPLFSTLTSLVHLALGDLAWSGRLVSLAASSLLPWPVYRLSSAMHGRRPALVAGLTVALWPWLADYGLRAVPEALAVTLWFAGAYALVRTLRDGGAWPFLAALAYGALYLTRPEGLFVLMAAPFAALPLCIASPDARARRLLPFAAVAALTVLAGVALTRLSGGPATVSTRLGDPASVARFVLADSGLTLARTALATWADALPVMLGPLLLVFAGAGLFMRDAARDGRTEATLALLALAQWALAIASTYPEPRYLMAVVVAVSLWSARGIALATARAAMLPRARALRVAPVAALVLMMLAGYAVETAQARLRPLPKLPYEYRLAGEWMRDHLEPGLVVTRKPQVGFYAGMPTTGPAPDESLDAMLNRVRAAGARYLVVDQRYTSRIAPALGPLLDPTRAPPGLRLLHDGLSPYPGGKVVIYEVLPDA
jgi:hypothetical protein